MRHLIQVKKHAGNHEVYLFSYTYYIFLDVCTNSNSKTFIILEKFTLFFAGYHIFKSLTMWYYCIVETYPNENVGEYTNLYLLIIDFL